MPALASWMKILPRSQSEDNRMTIEAHLSKLEQRHQALEDQIVDAQAHSSSDDLKIAELKRQKLHLKEEIEHLRQSVVVRQNAD